RIRGPRAAASVLNEVAEVFQFDRDVDVVDNHLLGYLQHDGGKVEDAGDAAAYQTVGDLLGGGGRHRQDGHAHASFPDDLLEFLHRVDGLRHPLVAASVDLRIEGGNDLKAFRLEATVGEERQSQVAYPDEDHGLQTFRAEQTADHDR